MLPYLTSHCHPASHSSTPCVGHPVEAHPRACPYALLHVCCCCFSVLGAVCRYHVTLVNSASEGTNPTNLHTHGLHIPGDGNADDVTRSVPVSPALQCLHNECSRKGGTRCVLKWFPSLRTLHAPSTTSLLHREVSGGSCLGHNYSIPADHEGGTFWYHAHR